MLQSLRLGFKVKAFHFYGRSARAEFWPFYLASWIVLACSFVLSLVPIVGSLIQAVVCILVVICQITATIRRLHDVNFRGWWLLVPYVLPVLYFVARQPIYVLYPEQAWTLDGLVVLCALSWLGIWGLCLRHGNTGNNRFGTDPLGLEPQQDFIDQRHLASPEYLGDPWRKFKARVAQEKQQSAQAIAAGQANSPLSQSPKAMHNQAVQTPGTVPPSSPALSPAQSPAPAHSSGSGSSLG